MSEYPFWDVMKSGALNVEDFSRMSSLGRVSGCDAKHLISYRGVMDGRAEEISLARARPDFNDHKFRDAVENPQRKKMYEKM